MFSNVSTCYKQCDTALYTWYLLYVSSLWATQKQNDPAVVFSAKAAAGWSEAEVSGEVEEVGSLSLQRVCFRCVWPS